MDNKCTNSSPKHYILKIIGKRFCCVKFLFSSFCFLGGRGWEENRNAKVQFIPHSNINRKNPSMFLKLIYFSEAGNRQTGEQGSDLTTVRLLTRRSSLIVTKDNKFKFLTMPTQCASSVSVGPYVTPK